MKIDIKELQANSYVLTINPVRLQLLRRTFEKCGLSSPAQINGLQNKSVCGGSCCSIGHRTIIQAAKLMNLPYVCIFEEDAYPRQDCASYLDEVLEQVPDDAECLVLGWSRITKNARAAHSEFIDRFAGGEYYGSHAYVLFSCAYDRILNGFNTVSDDKVISPDVITNKFLKNVYILKRPAFIQYSMNKSLHAYHDYIFQNGKGGKTPPEGFLPVDDLLYGDAFKNKTLDVFSYFVGRKYNDMQLMFGWYRNLKDKYCVNISKRFVIYTDNQLAKQFEALYDDVKVVVIDPVDDLNARKLMKFDLISDFFKKHDVSEYFSFIQSNCRCIQAVSITELLHGYDVALNKSCWWERSNCDSFLKYYCNTPGSVTYISKPKPKIPYLQAGHFIGKSRKIKVLTDWIVNAISIDLANNVHTKWHDETYLNYYYHFVNSGTLDIKLISGQTYLSGIQHSGKIVALDKSKLFGLLVDMDSILSSIANQIKTPKDKCLIIGSNPSILDFEQQKYIDESDYFIIRINTEPQQQYVKNYGLRTDLYITFENSHFLEKIGNKLIIKNDDIKNVSKAFNITPANVWLTTGFMTLLICIRRFHDISIFGFGYKSETNAEKSFKYHSIYVQNEKKSDHDLVYEHLIIDMLEGMEKIKRLESELSVVK